MAISTLLAIKASKHLELRNALRLFYWLKSQAVTGRFSSEILSKKDIPFSRYEVEKYLKILTNKFFLSKTNGGIYYLRGRAFLFRQVTTANSCSVVDIPTSALLTKKSWADFIFAVATSSVARSVRHSTKDQQPSAKPARQPVGTQRHSLVAVSLKILSRHTGLSQSSASRARKRAGASGHITLHSNIAPILRDGRHIKASVADMGMIRQELGPAVRLIGGVMCMQGPSLVTTMVTYRQKGDYTISTPKSARPRRDNFKN